MHRLRLAAAVPTLAGAAAALAACAALVPVAAAAPAGAARGADSSPGGVLGAFVGAAARNDAGAMWALLSAETRKRLGPVQAAFAKGAARDLSDALGGFARNGGSFKVRMSKPLGTKWAIAVITGARTIGGQAEAGAFGAALRGEGGGWRIELAGPVQLKVNEPRPGEVMAAPEPQLAVTATAKETVTGGILYADGVQLDGGAGGTGPMNLTIYGPAVNVTTQGVHFGAAIAATPHDASAVAWTFGFVPAKNVAGQLPEGLNGDPSPLWEQKAGAATKPAGTTTKRK